jgi:hypothetical protein
MNNEPHNFLLILLIPQGLANEAWREMMTMHRNTAPAEGNNNNNSNNNISINKLLFDDDRNGPFAAGEGRNGRRTKRQGNNEEYEQQAKQPLFRQQSFSGGKCSLRAFFTNFHEIYLCFFS